MIFNPLIKFYKSETGAIRENKKVTFRVKGNFGSVVLLVFKDGEYIPSRFVLQKNADLFECSIKLKRGLYFYHFEAKSYTFHVKHQPSRIATTTFHVKHQPSHTATTTFHVKHRPSCAVTTTFHVKPFKNPKTKCST